RDSHPKARIWAIVEPHGYKRTKALLSGYKSAFNPADKVIIGPIFKARDTQDPEMTPEKVAASSGSGAFSFDSFAKIKEKIAKETKKGDVIIVMGAGKSYLWAKEITDLFPATFADLTTFGIGGAIGKLFEVKTKEELIVAVNTAKKENLPVFVLGGGSDILVGDAGFSGVVIKFTGSGVTFSGSEVNAQAGCVWDDLVDLAVDRNLQGIECLSGIPGTVGAAPIQNIGAYGQELADTFISLTAYDITKGKFVKFNKEDCKFAYRESIFKDPKHWQKYVITDITLKLNKDKSPDVKYDSLKVYLADKKIKDPSLANVREAVLTIRRGKFEDPKEAGNAGSFFKNPIVNEEKAKSLMEKFPGIPLRVQPNGAYKGSAGWFIEQAGWKGKTHKNAAVSSRHALILINPEGKATAEEIIELSDKIIADVKEKFGITLEREVQVINFSENKFKDKKVAVLGLGIEGKDAVSFLLSQGAKVTVFDQKDGSELDFGSIDKKKIAISSGKDYLKGGLGEFDFVVRSPGFYRHLPEILEAEKKGAVITSPIKIFFDLCPGKIIGVTGTKGKGTTSTLIYEILKSAGLDVFLSGNIGSPYLELLPLLSPDSFVILEVSSFQLIDLEVSPHIAVILNITLDHMDWHKDEKEYVEAKKNIVVHQKPDDFAVINEDYDTPRSFAQNLKSKVIFFSKAKLDKKYKENLKLKGEHNLENIAAAVEVAHIMGIKEEVIKETVVNFKGLEHRLELVAEVSGRTFFNDSFATGPQPTIAAIKSFSEPETLILGGSDKGLDYSELAREINSSKNVQNILLIGAIGGKIGEIVKNSGYVGNIENLGSPSMPEIVKRAFDVTSKGGVIILSPAAASFDMFKNYKDRGNQFKNSVLKLK
ncbi:MAG TPA: UDP-N-acetylmuramoyl-L-alanine--D-glutamate ligase, partial [Patescibacteria group bacterium]|nr:UDP-N-acetylmuramoyl-L-alanine--D-glutamate ligase [Patescibacteria group bacterium]